MLVVVDLTFTGWIKPSIILKRSILYFEVQLKKNVSRYFPFFVGIKKGRYNFVRKQEYIVRSRELNKNIAKQTPDSDKPCPCNIIAQCPCNKNKSHQGSNNVRLFPCGNMRLYECSTLLERGMDSHRDTFNLLKPPDDCRTDVKTTAQPQDDATAELCSELTPFNKNKFSRTENGKSNASRRWIFIFN